MENILKLVKHNIKMFFKEPWGIVLLILPIVMSVAMIKMLSMDTMSVKGTIGILFSEQNQGVVEQLSKRLDEENVAVNLYCNQTQSDELKKESIDQFDVTMIVQDGDLLQAMAQGKHGIQIVYKEDGSSEAVKGTLEAILKEMQILAEVSKGSQEKFHQLYGALNEKASDMLMKAEGQEYMANKQAFGIFVMLLLMSGGYNLKTMAREKESRIYERIGRGPIRKHEYILGHVGGSLILLVTQVVLEWIVMSALKINFNLSIGTFLGIGITLVLVSVGIVLLLLALSKDVNMFGVLLGFVVPPMAMLSDCIFPIELLPEWIDKVSLIFPIRWIMKGYNVALMDGTVWNLLGCLMLASILAIIMILISIILEGKKNKI